jgi:hypothetical protein
LSQACRSRRCGSRPTPASPPRWTRQPARQPALAPPLPLNKSSHAGAEGARECKQRIPITRAPRGRLIGLDAKQKLRPKGRPKSGASGVRRSDRGGSLNPWRLDRSPQRMRARRASARAARGRRACGADVRMGRARRCGRSFVAIARRSSVSVAERRARWPLAGDRRWRISSRPRPSSSSPIPRVSGAYPGFLIVVQAVAGSSPVAHPELIPCRFLAQGRLKTALNDSAGPFRCSNRNPASSARRRATGKRTKCGSSAGVSPIRSRPPGLITRCSSRSAAS